MSLWRNLGSKLGFSVAAMPPVALPKVKAGQVGYGSHVKTITPSKSVITNVDNRTANIDLTTARAEATTSATIRKFAKTSPDLAAAKFAYLRLAITQGYKVKAYAMSGEFDEESTRLAYEILSRFDTLPDYVVHGYSNTPSIRSIAEAWGAELILEGACAGELVLNKARQPERIAPIAVSQIKFYEDGKGVRPVQKVGGDEIDLDTPTFFYTSLDQDLLTAYATSPMEAAIQPVIADASFTNDLRRALTRVILPRLAATMDFDKIKDMLPAEVKADPEKLALALGSIQSSIEQTVNSLKPEDALVSFDSVTYAYLTGGTGEATSLIDTVQTILNSKMATGAKALPSILGHGSGSQNVASSETLMFMKSADGAIRVPLNEMFSRILTLGVRLFAKDVKVTFEYDPIDLRPVTELEAFKAQKQSRILEQLSFGFITTAEASIELTGKLPRAGYEELAGTMFTINKADPNANNYSGTSTGGGGDTATGQAIKSKAPTNTRAGNKK